MRGSRLAGLFGLTLSALVIASAWMFGEWRGLADLAVYALALVPGLPLGFWLFGRRHAAGWIAGALIGYALTALTFTLVIKTGFTTSKPTLLFAVMWAVLTLTAFRVTPRPAEPLVPLAAWTKRETAALLLTLHLVPALITLPLANVGARDQDGSKQYRAYFIADFLWHMALTQEMSRFEAPPKNPYMFDKPVHYYWTYFVTPAVVDGNSTAPVERVETVLKTFAFGTALLMFSVVFLAALAVAERAWIAAVSATLALVGPSPEGLYALLHGQTLEGLRNVNVDYVNGGPPWHGLRIDGLFRSMIYTPQHSTSFALGLIAIIAAVSVTRPLSVAGRLVIGTVLGLSVVFNPFLGGIFALIYGVAMAADTISNRRGFAALIGHAIAAAPVLAGLGWCFWTKMAGGAGEHLKFGAFPETGHLPISSLALSLGTLLVPAAFGLLPWRRVTWRGAVSAIAALVIGLVVMHFVSLENDPYWAGFRAGNVLQITLPMLVARGLTGFAEAGMGAIGIVVVTAATLIGAPTTLIDARNARDVANRHAGPGFFWTDVLTPAQQAGLSWIRKNTPVSAVVQAHRLPNTPQFAVDYERQDWSIIQSVAGRRSAAANVLPLIPEPENADRILRVHAMFTSESADAAHATAKALGIEYLWIDQRDAFRLEFIERISARKDLFYAVFHQDSVYVIKIG